MTRLLYINLTFRRTLRLTLIFFRQSGHRMSRFLSQLKYSHIEPYLRNSKRVACVYNKIMHAGNVGRIGSIIFRAHYYTQNAQDEFLYFFYNISGDIT